MIYILYYSSSNYDDHIFGILKASKDRSKIEIIKNDIEKEFDRQKKENQDWLNRMKDFSYKEYNRIADWFEENKDAILEYPRGSKYGKWDNMGDGSFSLQGSWRSEKDYPDWHTKKGPYNPETIEKDKKDFIDKVRSGGKYDYEKYIDYSKVKTEFIDRKMFTEKQPPFTYRYLKNLEIEEVEEV